MSKAELCSLTWREVQQAFARNPVILIPMGSIEEHGPHVPVGDYRYAEEVSRRIAERTGSISAPTIPWGYSEYFKHFPGCLTLRPATLSALLLDICDGFIRHGLDHLLFVCGHKGNLSILEQVGREIKDRHRLRVATIEPWGWLTPEFLRELYGVDRPNVGHGSEPMGSLAMYLFPEELRPDLLEKGHPSTFADLPMRGMSTAVWEDVTVSLYCDMEEVTPNGVLGDPTLSSAEVGRKIMERVVGIGARFVEKFKTIPTRCEPPRLG